MIDHWSETLNKAIIDYRKIIRKITWLSLRKFSLLDQIKQESKSEAFKKHWILPKRNARKAKKRKEDAP